MLDQDKLETAALIAQEVAHLPSRRFSYFVAEWREVYGIRDLGSDSLFEARPYYEAYFGFDGRTWPTHDMITAQPLPNTHYL